WNDVGILVAEMQYAIEPPGKRFPVVDETGHPVFALVLEDEPIVETRMNSTAGQWIFWYDGNQHCGYVESEVQRGASPLHLTQNDLFKVRLPESADKSSYEYINKNSIYGHAFIIRTRSNRATDSIEVAARHINSGQWRLGKLPRGETILR